jgi:stress-induced morphogen
MVTAGQIEERIKEKLPSAQVRAVDMTGGGDHWQVAVKAAEFKGKSMVEQHQLVYGALGDWMKQDIHALALDTQILD